MALNGAEPLPEPDSEQITQRVSQLQGGAWKIQNVDGEVCGSLGAFKDPSGEARVPLLPLVSADICAYKHKADTETT